MAIAKDWLRPSISSLLTLSWFMPRIDEPTALSVPLEKGLWNSCRFSVGCNALVTTDRSWSMGFRKTRCRLPSIIFVPRLGAFFGGLPMPSIDLHGEVFHYASVGDGPPFVFQHGMGADTTQPLDFGGDLLGWRTIALDCRGHGLTEASLDRGRISFAQFAQDLAAFLDSLRIERAVVGGISMGAGVALAFGLAHPDRVAGLILVRPAWLDRPFPPNLRWFPIAARLLQEFPVDEAARRFQQMPEFLELRAASQFAADSLLGQFQRRCARERAGILAEMPARVPVESLSDCQRLQIPVRVVVNPHDPVHPDILGEELAAAIPGAALSRITSKTESEVLHRADLSRVLNDSLKPLRQQLSR
jgi:pimeloyl-ACP methyl ester carboxylesterase